MNRNYIIRDKQLKQKVRSVIEKNTGRVITIGNKVNKEIRTKTIVDWYKLLKSTNYGNMLHSIEFGYDTHWHGDMARTVVFYSGINKNTYQHPESLHRQINKYPGIDDDRTFVINQQWKEGVLGLPEHWVHGLPSTLNKYADTLNNYYENPFYKNGKPLYDFTKSKYKYNWGKVSRIYKSKWKQ